MGSVLVSSSKMDGPEAPLTESPTTTALKKLPGRSISTDFRGVSDHLLANLFCVKSDYPENKMTD